MLGIGFGLKLGAPEGEIIGDVGVCTRRGGTLQLQYIISLVVSFLSC